MLTFIKIAWRNILRNKNRSLITISAVGFGLGALIFIWSFVEGAHKQMVENYTSLLTSHIQIHAKGYHAKPKLESTVPHPEKVIQKIQNNPMVKASSPRVRAEGLLTSTNSSSGVFILGIDPAREPQISRLHKSIKEGQFIDSAHPRDVVLGQMLADTLDVGIGSKVVVMSQALDGSVAAGAFYVKGLLETGTEEIDRAVMLINYNYAQELFNMVDQASEIAIRVVAADKNHSIAKEIQSTLDYNFLEILPWQETSKSFQQWIEFDNGFIWLIVMVLMIVVAIGILNTVLMGVLERTRDFGVLLALGTKPKEIIQMVVWESFFLGTVGSLTGLGIGFLLTHYFQIVGINLTVFTKALNSFYIDAVIYPVSNMTHIGISTALVLSTSIIVCLYPALRAARLKPIEAIRSF
jgi:ABC-type lipoprotein release transport system permease subunit